MSDKTWRELRTIWTGETCDALDAHVKCVFREELAKHVAECHAKPKIADAYEPIPNPLAFDSIPPISTKPDAGDWAMEAWQHAVSEFNQSTHDGNADNIDAAKAIREAAERHYGAIQKRLADNHAKTIQERDAARERLKENGERITQLQGYMIALADMLCASYPSPMTDATFAANIMAATKKTIAERDAARAEVERVRSELLKLGASKQPNENSCIGVLMKVGNLLQLPGPVVNPGDVLAAVEKLVKPPPAATGDDELRSKLIGAFAMWRNDPNDERECDEVAYVTVRSAFDAVRRERDKVTTDRDHWKVNYDDMANRAEAAEAALGELKEAVNNLVARNKRWFVWDNQDSVLPTDAILAAYRATKATPVAEGTVTG